MFEEIVENIKKQLDMDDKFRESTLKMSRESVRFSQEAVRAIHRGEFKAAQEALKKAQKSIGEVAKNIKEACPQLYYKGYVTVMHQEFVEASLFLAITEGKSQLQKPEELGVSNYAYLQGLGDLVGELRRHALEAMRNDDFKGAIKALGLMEEIYDLLMTLDYPEGLIPGTRRKIDVARGLIEKTKGDLAYLQHGNKLVMSINKLLEKLKNKD